MTITLELPPELEGQIQQVARAQGKDVAAFLLDSIRQRLRHDVLPEADARPLQIINAPIAPARDRFPAPKQAPPTFPRISTATIPLKQSRKKDRKKRAKQSPKKRTLCSTQPSK